MSIDYKQFVTGLFKQQPNFGATIDALTRPFRDIIDQMAVMNDAFDVDTAVGAQLDVIGQWVGASRYQLVPIGSATFTWNGGPLLGWNRASWKGRFDVTNGITTLDDRSYRALIHGKIAANYWDGTVESLNAIGQQFLLPAFGIQAFVFDNFNMTMTVYLLGSYTNTMQALVQRGVLIPKPAGVQLLVSDLSGAPTFGLDVPPPVNQAGLDVGVFP